MALQLISPSAEEPVSLAEAKLHLRVGFPDDDALIMAIIVAARRYAEMFTRRQFVTVRWRLVLDWVPRVSLAGAAVREAGEGGILSAAGRHSTSGLFLG